MKAIMSQFWAQSMHDLGGTGTPSPEDFSLGGQWGAFLLCVEAAASNSYVLEHHTFVIDTVEVAGMILEPWIGAPALLSAPEPFDDTVSRSTETMSNTTVDSTTTGGTRSTTTTLSG